MTAHSCARTDIIADIEIKRHAIRRRYSSPPQVEDALVGRRAERPRHSSPSHHAAMWGLMPPLERLLLRARYMANILPHALPISADMIRHGYLIRGDRVFDY